MTHRIFFNDDGVSEKYKNLQSSSSAEDKRILKALNKAIDNIEKDPFSGIQIPKRLIPKR